MLENEMSSTTSTNINVRTSSNFKSQLIEEAAKRKLSLTEYVVHILTKELSGQNDSILSDEYKDLLRKIQKLEAELARYQTIAAPFKSFIGKEMQVDGKSRRFEHLSEIIEFIVKSFKITDRC